MKRDAKGGVVNSKFRKLDAWRTSENCEQIGLGSKRYLRVNEMMEMDQKGWR